MAGGQGRTVQFTLLFSRQVQILQGSSVGTHVSMCCMREKKKNETKKKPKQIVRKESNIMVTGMLAVGVDEGK